MIVMDPDVGVSSAELAEEWDADEQARTVGTASVESSARGEFLPDTLTLVAIPIAVNLASTAITGIVTRLVAKLRNTRPNPPVIEMTEWTNVAGDRVVVVRLRRERS